MSKLRWGVLSTAKIGVKQVIPAMQQSAHCVISAIASRDAGRARATADKLGIEKSYGSYEELLADDDVDAVYNPLPNHLHAEWSILAIEAGKHVLCEKPIGLSADEGRQILAAAAKRPELKVMEAFMYRHHPQWRRAIELVGEGAIGKLGAIQAFFSYFNDTPGDIRNQAEIGGGGLMDIGCYAISLSRFVFAAEPKRVCGWIDYDPNFKTDRLTSAMLDFDGGVATFTCSTQLERWQRVNIFGDGGRIEIEIPFNAPADRPCKMWLQRGGQLEEIVLDVCNQYGIQGDLFAQAVMNDTPTPTPLADAVANMEVIEAIVRSAKNGAWEVV